MRNFILVFSVLIFSAPTFAATLQCKIQTLQKLGWHVDVDDTIQTAQAGQMQGPCEATSIQEIQDQNLLHLRLPKEGLEKASTSKIVDQALQSVGTRCAYATQVKSATAKATAQLQYNHLYWFTPFWKSGNIRMERLSSSWQRVVCPAMGDYCYTPKGPISQAMADLDNGSFTSECATGLQLAQYKVISELFSPTELNQRFRDEEFFVGYWDSHEHSATVLNINKPSNYRNIPAEVVGNYRGSTFFSGQGGYIGALDTKKLDDIINTGENFLFVKTSKAGSDAFAKNGGIAYYNKLAKAAWESVPRFDSGEMDQAAIEDVKPMLSDPFLKDSVVYIHGVGYTTLQHVLLGLMSINPRTAYDIRFYYKESMQGEVYQRWLQSQMDACSAQ